MADGVRINKAKANAAVTAMSQAAVMRGANRYRERVRREILQEGRVNTGEMMQRIDVRPLPPRPGVAQAVVSPRTKHFVYQDRGTRGAQARKGGALVFRPKGSAVLVFAKNVRGVTAGRFLAKARAKMKAQDFA